MIDIAHGAIVGELFEQGRYRSLFFLVLVTDFFDENWRNLGPHYGVERQVEVQEESIDQVHLPEDARRLEELCISVLMSSHLLLEALVLLEEDTEDL